MTPPSLSCITFFLPLSLSLFLSLSLITLYTPPTHTPSLTSLPSPPRLVRIAVEQHFRLPSVVERLLLGSERSSD